MVGLLEGCLSSTWFPRRARPPKRDAPINCSGVVSFLRIRASIFEVVKVKTPRSHPGWSQPPRRFSRAMQAIRLSAAQALSQAFMGLVLLPMVTFTKLPGRVRPRVNQTSPVAAPVLSGRITKRQLSLARSKRCYLCLPQWRCYLCLPQWWHSLWRRAQAWDSTCFSMFPQSNLMKPKAAFGQTLPKGCFYWWLVNSAGQVVRWFFFSFFFFF